MLGFTYKSSNYVWLIVWSLCCLCSFMRARSFVYMCLFTFVWHPS